ncbi:MAG: hypothetical protein IKA79_06950 [Lentisphaeria bacterium]|nr:hypothetical protein [Lentisphaeria bacterium]
MNIAKVKGFAVIAFSKDKLQGAVFRRIKTKHELLRHVSLAPDETDPVNTWKELFRTLAISRDEPLFLCGALKKSFFFRTKMAEIPVKNIRSALALELPRRMLASGQENLLTEFSILSSGGKTSPENQEKDNNGEIRVNVCVFPADSLETLSGILLQCGRKADAYIYPFLALQEDDPPLYLPEVEKNYYFAMDSWQVVSGNTEDPAGSNEAWEKIFSGKFKLPPSFSVRDSLVLLLCARYVLSPGYAESEEGMDILPAKLRPSRLKSQIKLGVILLTALLLNILWSCSGQWIENAKNYKFLSREKAVLQEENRKLKAKIRKIEKDSRERQKFSTMKAGEHDIVKKLNDLTAFLPSNVMVSSMRWSDSGLDLTMFSEDNSSISEIFRSKFPYWKLANIQQRNFGGAATMIIVKLTINDENAFGEGGIRR